MKSLSIYKSLAISFFILPSCALLRPYEPQNKNTPVPNEQVSKDTRLKSDAIPLGRIAYTPPPSRLTYTQAKNVVATARTYVGTPYKYGGNTTLGIDCSGLVCVAFKAQGYTLPRTSVEMGNVGYPITTAVLRPGDLLFFATGDAPNKITHVGIVTEYKSEMEVLFIHSPNSGVREDNFYTKYYQKTFVKAMRPF